MQDAEVKTLMSEEMDRLRERADELNKKVKAHNDSVADIDKRKAEVLAEGEVLSKDQAEIQEMQGEIGPMVAKL